jgi:hypothetical protein
MGHRPLGHVAVPVLAIGVVMAMAATAMASARASVAVVSTDPYTTTQNYHQTEVEPDTFSFGSTIVGTFQVGRFVDGGANNIGWATTTDNGATWDHGFLPGTTVYANPPGTYDRISDPAVAYDAQDDVWMISGLAITGTTGKAVLVNRSFDGGLTWQNPVTVSIGGGGSFYDKEWIACDNTPSSPNYGNCYVEWDDANLGGLLKMSRSTDGGQTWQSSTVPSASVIGGQPVVQPDGTVVMPISGNGPESFVSTNGGQSYTGPFTISNFQLHGASGMRDGGGLVSAEVDGAGKVYVAWYDCRFRSGCSADDIVFSTSTDGKTWSAVKRIPVVPTSSASEIFLPGMGVDHSTSGATAHLGVTYYFFPNGNCTPNSCKLNAGFISSTDGGQTWSSAKKLFGPIHETGLPNPGGYFVGDYISTSFGSNGRAYPVIASARGSSCVTGNPTACQEPMVAPVHGLGVTGGDQAATTGPVFAGGRSGRPATAF